VHVTTDGRYRVHGGCQSLNEMQAVKWFVLPPIQEFYFKSRNVYYRPLPPFRNDCDDPQAVASLEVIYPRSHAKIFLPVELDGRTGSSVFEAAHRRQSATVYWHLDGQFIGATRSTHRFELSPGKGTHSLVLVDDAGETVRREFEVISTR
jgi:penicillin-binding protein 1C